MSDDPAHGIHPLARLLRGFAVDFLTCHDAGVVPRIMTPDYRLHIGGVVFDGRDTEYLPATAAKICKQARGGAHPPRVHYLRAAQFAVGNAQPAVAVIRAQVGGACCRCQLPHCWAAFRKVT